MKPFYLQRSAFLAALMCLLLLPLQAQANPYPDDRILASMEQLKKKMFDLEASGELMPPGKGLGYVYQMLYRAQGVYERGRHSISAVFLKRYIGHVERLVRTNKLSSDNGNILMTKANNIIWLLADAANADGVGELLSINPNRPQRSTFGGETPDVFVLDQNYPNPFNPSTVISFELPEASEVRLSVFDVMGREVMRLADGSHAAGNHQVTFEAGNLPSGAYLYRLETPGFVTSKVMHLVK